MKTVDLMTLGGKAIDRKALKVTMPGNHYEPASYGGTGKGGVVFDVMPALSSLPKLTDSQRDISGVRNGRLVAIAYFGASRWLCRCDCGKYTLRKGKSMLIYKPDGDMCVLCNHWRKIKDREFRERVGKWPDEVRA